MKYLLALMLLMGLGSSNPNIPERHQEQVVQETLGAVNLLDDNGYYWSYDDIQCTALMAQTEAGGMGEDAMLSVISTAYARVINPKWCSSYYCSTNLCEEIERPNQFVGPTVARWQHGKDVYDIIKPSTYMVVFDFIRGARGSCSGSFYGYEYFNSVLGGTVACKIEAEGQFIEFFSSQKFEEAQVQGLFRNIEIPIRKSISGIGYYLWRVPRCEQIGISRENLYAC